eukprot:scaffold2162_cov398-Prasinococcus_capsulatus_cf.AAC.8
MVRRRDLHLFKERLEKKDKPYADIPHSHPADWAAVALQLLVLFSERELVCTNGACRELHSTPKGKRYLLMQAVA